LNVGDEQIKAHARSDMKELWGHSLGAERGWTWLSAPSVGRTWSCAEGLLEDPVGLAAARWRRHVSIQCCLSDAFLGGGPCRGERAV